MRSVSMAEFETGVSAFVLAAKGGEDILITRDGRPMATLTAVDPDGGAALREDERAVAQREEDRRAEQRAAVRALFELGREQQAKYGSVSIDEIIEWKNEGRR